MVYGLLGFGREYAQAYKPKYVQQLYNRKAGKQWDYLSSCFPWIANKEGYKAAHYSITQARIYQFEAAVFVDGKAGVAL